MQKCGIFAPFPFINLWISTKAAGGRSVVWISRFLCTWFFTGLSTTSYICAFGGIFEKNMLLFVWHEILN